MKKLSLILFAMLSSSAMASDGGCPKGEQGESLFNLQTPQKGIVSVELNAETPLDNQSINAPGWNFRARTVTISPGAVIPLHSHDRRPETAVIKYGTLTIYETDCKVGYKMKEGDVYQSGKGISHVAVNESDHYAVMYVVDLVDKDNFPINNQVKKP